MPDGDGTGLPTPILGMLLTGGLPAGAGFAGSRLVVFPGLWLGFADEGCSSVVWLSLSFWPLLLDLARPPVAIKLAEIAKLIATAAVIARLMDRLPVQRAALKTIGARPYSHFFAIATHGL